jgi:hypothetical protein
MMRSFHVKAELGRQETSGSLSSKVKPDVAEHREDLKDNSARDIAASRTGA